MLRSESHCSPLAMVVIRDKNKDQFILSMLADHSYVDGQSVNHIFKLIVEYYNSCLEGEADDQIIKSAAQLRTIGVKEVEKILIDAQDCFDHTANIEKIINYRNGRQDLSNFMLIEQNMVGEPLYFESPLAFTVTNRTNHDLALGKLCLKNCKFKYYIDLLNINPESVEAASYMNKQTITISLDAMNQLAIGISPSMTKVKPLEKLLDLFPQVVNKELLDSDLAII